MDKEFLTGLGIDDDVADAVMEEHNTFLNSVRLDYELEKEITKRGAKSLSAAMKLFDKEGLSFNNGVIEGLDERMDSFEKENSFLFEKTGTKPVFSKQIHSDEGITKEEFDKMGYAKRLKLFNDNPEIYNRLKN